MRRTVTRTITQVVIALSLVACGGAAAAPTTIPATPVASARGPASPSLSPTPAPTGRPVPSATPAPTVDPADLARLDRAIGVTLATGSADMAIDAVFADGSAIPAGTTFAGGGQVSFGEPRQAHLRLDMSAMGAGEMEMIIDGSVVYLRGTAFERVAKDGVWLRIDLTSDHPNVGAFRSLASGQNDASLALYYLAGAAGRLHDVDEEALDGTMTHHLSVPVDLVAALDRVPTGIRDQLRINVAQIRDTGTLTTVDADAWIDDTDLVRRVAYTYHLGANAGGGTMTVTFDLSRFGEPMDLGVPAMADTIDIETLVLDT